MDRILILVGMISIIIFLSLDHIEGIKCYQCQDDDNKEDPKPCHGLGNLKDCPKNFHLCSVARDPATKDIYRGCQENEAVGCKKSGDDADMELCNCDHDNCNKEWTICCPEMKAHAQEPSHAGEGSLERKAEDPKKAEGEKSDHHQSDHKSGSPTLPFGSIIFTCAPAMLLSVAFFGI